MVMLVSSIGGDVEAQGGMCQVHSFEAGKGQALDSSMGSGLQCSSLHSTLRVVSGLCNMFSQ